MDEEKSKVQEVKIEGEEIVIIFRMNAKQYIEKTDFLSWSDRNDLKGLIAKLVAEKIWEQEGKVIIDQVLKEVNWPDVVRSKIAQKVIANAGKENWD